MPHYVDIIIRFKPNTFCS